MTAEEISILKPSGERMIPDVDRNEPIYAEHLTRYVFASQFVKGKRVLDVACGSGYGVHFLRLQGAQSVVGIDVSRDAVTYAQKRYAHEGVSFFVADAQEIPLTLGLFDIIVSFETIEHLKDQEAFLLGIKRILKPDGIVLLSTPNALVYPIGNPFHEKELTVHEFNSLLSAHFKKVELFFQHNVFCSYVFSKSAVSVSEGGVQALPFKAATIPENQHLYLLAIAGASIPSRVSNSVLLFNNNELERVYASRGWKFVLFIRRIKNLILGR